MVKLNEYTLVPFNYIYTYDTNQQYYIKNTVL